jgi:hypothetical protein
MRIKQDLSTYNVSVYLRLKSWESERRRGPNKKKIHEFMIHNVNSVRIAIDAGNFDATLRHCLHAPHPLINVKVITYQFCCYKRKRK